ncbi:MAG TPA: transposase [Phototrophicaceae bacterium]|nr:transposase [Phototrophicaceae bacterium]
MRAEPSGSRSACGRWHLKWAGRRGDGCCAASKSRRVAIPCFGSCVERCSCRPRVLASWGLTTGPLKKGRDYGTLMVDLERHQVVDVLLERTASVVRDWLQNQPQVQLITRDRSTEYANGIQAGAPQASAVADRWHLLLNLRQMLQR